MFPRFSENFNIIGADNLRDIFLVVPIECSCLNTFEKLVYSTVFKRTRL